MNRFRQFAALLLLTVWLPVTHHCALEAAGLLDQAGWSDCVLGKPCPQDSCGTAETALFKSLTALPNVSAPALSVCACLLCLHAANAALVENATVIQRNLAENARAWVPAWHFVRRTSPPSRAPSFHCA